MPITSSASGVKAGTVAYFGASSAPAGWLKANGAAVSRTLYGALFTAIGTTYGVGDGSTTFNVPDLRGEFLRALDDGRGVDAARAIGSAQGDVFKSHDHASATYRDGLTGGAFTDGYLVGAPVNARTQYANGKVYAEGGAETRPRNVALLACIKF